MKNDHASFPTIQALSQTVKLDAAFVAVAILITYPVGGGVTSSSLASWQSGNSKQELASLEHPAACVVTVAI